MRVFYSLLLAKFAKAGSTAPIYYPRVGASRRASSLITALCEWTVRTKVGRGGRRAEKRLVSAPTTEFTIGGAPKGTKRHLPWTVRLRAFCPIASFEARRPSRRSYHSSLFFASCSRRPPRKWRRRQRAPPTRPSTPNSAVAAPSAPKASASPSPAPRRTTPSATAAAK